MTITLARPVVDEALALAALAGALSVTCEFCGVIAQMDEDRARTRWGWSLDVDGLLACEDCVTAAGPTGLYDRAYWG